MALDPQIQTYVDQLAASGDPPRHTLSPDAVRATMAAELASEATLVALEPVAVVENRIIPGPVGKIPIRIYTPQGVGPFPLVVYFHGGGWVLGTLDSYDGLSRSIANGARCVVITVDFRLAPEHPFPAAPEDCYAATCWVAEHAGEINGDATRIAIAGDSAGGCLAAVVAQMAREEGAPPLEFQLMVYPITDLRMKTASYRENADAPNLTKDDMIWFRRHYLTNEADIVNPLASPLLAPDLSNLPPALIVTAEYDPLRDEGEGYGERLRQAGVRTAVWRYDSLIHGFLGLDQVADRARVARSEIIAALRAALVAPTAFEGSVGLVHS